MLNRIRNIDFSVTWSNLGFLGFNIIVSKYRKSKIIKDINYNVYHIYLGYLYICIYL